MKTQDKRQPFILIFGQILLKKRWLVFVVCVTVVMVIETIEHWPLKMALERHFLNEIFFYGLIGPLVIWILLTMLDRALRQDLPLDRIQAEATRTERQRIARDLHDKLAQNIGFLHFKLDQLASSGETTLTEIESIRTDLEQMRQIADQAYEQVRGTLDSLRLKSDELPDDLAEALQNQAKTIANQTNLDISVNCQHNVGQLCPIIKRTVFDISQEALTNIAKHAAANQATVNLVCGQSDAFLTISDDGKGFYIGDSQKEGHYGLDIMHERAKEVGGLLKIESIPGQGTQLTAQFPNSIISQALLQKCESVRCNHLTLCEDENSIS